MDRTTKLKHTLGVLGASLIFAASFPLAIGTGLGVAGLAWYLIPPAAGVLGAIGGGVAALGALIGVGELVWAEGERVMERHRGFGLFATKSGRVRAMLQPEFPKWKLQVSEKGNTIVATQYDPQQGRRQPYVRLQADAATGQVVGEAGRKVTTNHFIMAGNVLIPVPVTKHVAEKTIPAEGLDEPQRRTGELLVQRAREAAALTT